MIPLRIAVLIEDRVTAQELVAWYIVDYIIDVFFLIDMVLRARRFHTVQDDRVIDLPSQIWKKYCSWSGNSSHVVDEDEVLTHSASGHATFVSASRFDKAQEKDVEEKNGKTLMTQKLQQLKGVWACVRYVH